ncbi:MAG: DUF7662 domain-containing protein [Caulobacteraceae bacterium]
MSSKYDPLRRYLEARPPGETPMSFRDVERVLGFPLPDSARRHPAWWSNNPGTHVGVRAWRDAGCRTSRVDIGGERVTFVREAAPMASVREDSPPFLRDAAPRSAAATRREDVILVSPASLSLSALRMIDDYAEATGLDRAAAVAVILEASAAMRQRQLLDSLAVAAMPPGHDSTPLIRQDRDEP